MARCLPALVAVVLAGFLAPAARAGAFLRQYPIPLSGGVPPAAEAIVSGPDGALWFTESAVDRIGRVTTGGSFSSYPITPGSHPVGIAAGPDRALWFTEAATSRIGRITTAGVVAEYPITPASHPVGIAAGPDGALWFTEYSGNRIGRIATDGTIAEYPLSTPQAQPVAITAGPDGALWFTEFGAGKVGQIGRIDPATHAVSEFPAYPAGSGTATAPQGITAGPDGALWFTEQTANKIGRLTVGGALTEYPAGPGPFGITLGSDRALWFTEAGMGLPGEPSAPGLIGRLMTTGVLDLFPLHPQIGESANDITAGSDGAIWITDAGTIARVSGDLSAPVPVISGLSMTRRSFRVAPGPRRSLTTFHFRLSADSGWGIAILRRRPGKLLGPGDCRPTRPRLAAFPSCVALTQVAVLQRPAARAGAQSIGFTGYGSNRRRLPPGRYQASAAAFATGSARPRARSIRFTILP